MDPQMEDDVDYMAIARSFIGLRELKGPRHEAKIVEMFHFLGHPHIWDDETAWCAAFVGFCLEKAGLPSTRSLLARSYLRWGVPVSLPAVGNIVVLKRGDSSWQGHVGFVERFDRRNLWVLGGNQRNAVTVQRFSGADVLGYRLPGAGGWLSRGWVAEPPIEPDSPKGA